MRKRLERIEAQGQYVALVPQGGAAQQLSPHFDYKAIVLCTTLLIVKPYIKRLDYDIQEMLQLRREGWSLLRLALKFNRSHCTVLYHCKRNGVEPEQQRIKIPKFLVHTRPSSFKRRIKIRKPGDKYLDLIDEPVQQGKSYKEYLAESLQRKAERDYYERCGEQQEPG